jgi:hypothetical protein
MTTKDKISRVLKPTLFLFLLGLCLSFGHLVVLWVHGVEVYYNQFYATICGIPLMLIFLFFLNDSYPVRHKKHKGFLIKINSILGTLSLFVGLICMFELFGNVLQGASLTGNMSDDANFIVLMLFSSSGCVIICFISIWTKYAAKKDTAHALNGRIFYEKQTFHIWPFWYYWENKVLEETFSVSFKTKVPSSPRELTFFFNPQYDFKGAQADSITGIDLRATEGHVEWGLSELVLEGGEIAEMSNSDLLRGQARPKSFDFNFPVVWDGQFTILTH